MNHVHDVIGGGQWQGRIGGIAVHDVWVMRRAYGKIDIVPFLTIWMRGDEGACLEQFLGGEA